MNNSDSFYSYHPFVNLLYFLVVIIFSMTLMNPILLVISLISSFIYSVYLNKLKAVKFNLLYLTPIILLTTIINPAFNHNGETILFYINDNPITNESILFGFATGVMLVSVFMWFSCYNKIMTSDKFIFIFGRIIPSLSLILSMVLRFVPQFKRELDNIRNAQKFIGKDVKDAKLLGEIKHGINILSILITTSIENSIITEQSMKARGYGSKKRTSFKNFALTNRDILCLLLIIASSVVLLYEIFADKTKAYYFPVFYMPAINTDSLLIYLDYILLLNIPIFINLMENTKWKIIKSKI